VLFRNAYANPVCSPTRATFHTGRYSFRTGVTWVVWFGGKPLSHEEFTLPELLATAGYARALFGKWHLGDSSNGGDNSPNLAGWSHFAGHIRNIWPPETYYNWRKVVNGTASTSTVYATTENVNDALTWIRAQTGPWVCCLCFNAAHYPFHAPPPSLHTRKLPSVNPSTQPTPFFKAMVEAMDTEIGRLLQSLGKTTLDKTNIIFLGDNGTPARVSEPPFLPSHAKITLYEGGVNVPLIVSGPVVKTPAREVKALVDSVDIFPTIAELSGINARQVVPKAIPIDGISFVPYLKNPLQTPLRRFSYAEMSGGSRPGVAIRNATYKLIRWNGSDAFFDLAQDPFEKNNLLLGKLSTVQQTNHDALVLELARLKADYMPFGSGCKGQGGVPRLELVGGKLPRLGQSFTIEMAGIAPKATAAVGVAGLSSTFFGNSPLPIDLTPTGMLGCKLFISVDLPAALSLSGGRARWSLAIPASPLLLGARFYQQGLVLELGANSAGKIVTAGASARIGAR
jgi:arylsulfatase A-like enzyme